MSSSDRILYILKTQGPRSAQRLAEQLGLTSMGARKQLENLSAEALVEGFDIRSGVGRPARHWRLTAAGHGRFPDRHEDVTLQLIEGVRELFGEAGLEKLITQREQKSETVYRAHLQGHTDLAARVQALAALRAQEGYMAEALADGEDWLLIEHHCPICAAATACQNFCRSELALFQRCLGETASVQRAEHLLAGARRCVYRITATKT